MLVIDTLTSAIEAKKLLESIRSVTDKPIRWVVNTHEDFDHVFGNNTFADLGATIIGQENAIKTLPMGAEYVLANLTGYGFKPEDMVGMVITLPTLTFSNKATIDLGGISAEIYYPGPTHSLASVYVYLPTEKILFTGDMLFTDYHPYFGRGDLKNWNKTLDLLAKLDVDKIIPGHGPLSTKDDLVKMKEYLNIFDKEAKRIVAAAKNKKDITTITKLVQEKLPNRKCLNGLIGMNISEKYLPKEKN